MKLKKEHIAFLNEAARLDFDSALQMVDGVNMLSEVEYERRRAQVGLLGRWNFKRCI